LLETTLNLEVGPKNFEELAKIGLGFFGVTVRGEIKVRVPFSNKMCRYAKTARKKTVGLNVRYLITAKLIS
jgi:hypothetical protein